MLPKLELRASSVDQNSCISLDGPSLVWPKKVEQDYLLIEVQYVYVFGLKLNPHSTLFFFFFQPILTQKLFIY